MDLNPQVDIVIDRYALDEEAETIAYLIYRYDSLWNKVIGEIKASSNHLTRLEEELKELKGSIAFRAKTNPTEYGLPSSPSDKLCENYVYTNPEYIEKRNEIFELKDDLSVLETREHKYKNFHYALMVKRDSISELIKLYLSDYFARPENYSKKHITEDLKHDEMVTHNEKMNKHLQEILSHPRKEIEYGESYDKNDS